ncbi:MAG: zinc ribbon domain-containing protein [Pseudomonadota bacterium]
MPFYEYRCEECGHELEALQKISDEPLVDCPNCGASALRKLVSAAAFRLKGGGWYETDFKKDGKKNLAGDAAESSAKSDKSDSGGDGKSGGDSKKTGTEGKKAESKPTSGNNKGATSPA